MNNKFLLPSPNFDKMQQVAQLRKPHFLTPSGMTLLPREKQPPAMYGPRGATLPPKYLHNYQAPPEEQLPAARAFCEACEMEFQSAQDLQRHRQQHEHCPVAGCKFRGHYSVMDRHVLALHSSGLFEKVKSMSTPEEIAAWREERRKKYPTAANVQLRQQAQQERMRRGERLEASKSRFGRREERKRPSSNKMKRLKKQQRMKSTRVQSEESGKSTNSTETNSALSLLGMYASDEEQEEDIEAEKCAAEKSDKAEQKIETEIADNSSDEAPCEAPVERKSTLPPAACERPDKQAKRKFMRKSGLNFSNLYKRKQNTMLEKLLETDIRHERNVLLQCVRYVVDNNFFDIGSEKS